MAAILQEFWVYKSACNSGLYGGIYLAKTPRQGDELVMKVSGASRADELYDKLEEVVIREIVRAMLRQDSKIEIVE